MEIKISFPGGKQVLAEYDGMKVLTDQPVKAGGSGMAPQPFMLFLSSIGTCAGYYVLSFCQSRNIPTEGIRLIQSQEFVSLGKGKHRLAKIKIDIIVPPDFPEKYYDALIRAVDQCAVKKAIYDPPEFEVRTIAKAE
ncbi:MAG: osmotically inducible protein OsmC [Nitrospirae bacterium]|nr:MAG: osmotically inducible protein OsmC [Nitrospirota bacterium]